MPSTMPSIKLDVPFSFGNMPLEVAQDAFDRFVDRKSVV